MSDVVDFLHRAGEQYRDHIQLLRRQKALEEMRKTPFRPTISPYAEKVAGSTATRRSEAVEERLFHLHKQKLEWDQQQRERKAKEELAAQQHTHHPRITAKAARMRIGDQVERSARWASEREARLRAAQADALRREFREASGVPRITLFAHEKALIERCKNVPIEDHLLEQAKSRRHRRPPDEELHLTTSSALGSGVEDSYGSKSSTTRGRRPFEPMITKYAARLKHRGSVVDRLYHRSDSLHSNTFDEDYEMHCTFKPNVCEASLDMASSHYEDPTTAFLPVHERLYRNPQSKSQSQNRQVAEAPPPALRISPTSRHMAERRRRMLAMRGNASVDSILEPTIASRQRSVKTGTAGSTEVETDDLCFHPHVSTASATLWRRQVRLLQEDGHVKNADEARQLLWERARSRKAEALQRERERRAAQELAECTFQPTANRAPARRIGQRKMTVAERGQMWVQQRERRMETLRQELEEEEQEECTYQPFVDPIFPLPREGSEPAPGTVAFLRRQEEARRRREEDRHWWKPKHRTRRATDGNRSTASHASPSEISDTNPLPSPANHHGRESPSQRRLHTEDDKSAERGWGGKTDILHGHIPMTRRSIDSHRGLNWNGTALTFSSSSDGEHGYVNHRPTSVMGAYQNGAYDRETTEAGRWKRMPVWAPEKFPWWRVASE